MVDRRRGLRDRRQSEEQGEREGLRARLRRAHRQAPVDLPHDSESGRVRQRHLATRLVGLHGQHRRLGADLGRRGAGPRLPAGGTADGRLLRRPASRRQPVQREPGRRRSADRRAQAGTSSSCTTACGTWTSRARRSWPTSSSTDALRKTVAQPTKQAFLYVFDRADRRTHLADRRAARAARRRARRVVLADAADAQQAAGLRPAGLLCRRSDRLHAGAARRSRGRDRALPDRTDVHAAGREQGRGPDRHAHPRGPGRRHQLARRLLRSGDRHPLRGFRELAAAARTRAAAARRLRSALSPGHGAHRRPARGWGGFGHRRRRRRSGLERPERAGAAARQAALQPHQRHRPDHRRDPLAGAARRDVRRRQEPSGAQGARHPAHRAAGEQRGHARDQDAGHRRRRQLRTDTLGHTGRDAASLRQGARAGKSPRSRCRRRRADRR